MTDYFGGFWYKTHCLEIEPLKRPPLEYKYAGEEWQQLEADFYSISQDPGHCEVDYHISFDVQEIDENGTLIQVRNFIYGIGYIDSPDNINIYLSHPYDTGAARFFRVNLEWVDFYGNPQSIFFTPSASLRGFAPDSISEIEFFVYRDGQFLTESDYINQYLNGVPCGDCIFQVYQGEEIIHEETRVDCPIVIFDDTCQASGEIERVTIETAPLGFIRVTNSRFSQDGNLLGDLTPECVDIYNVIPFIPVGGQLGETAGVIYEFVGQYCSTVGCEPPNITHHEDECPCESCPQGTCAIECNDHICCYNSEGIAVQSILKANYCND